MAVLEIAKIQVRRGQENQTGMPQLDGGEFGWAIDTQKLYIGNGSTSEGAPLVGNTEILTNHSVLNIFSVPTYVYGKSYENISKGEFLTTIQTPVVTGQSGNDILRTISAKLDDFVNVLDYGIYSDENYSQDTRSIQYAIDQVCGATSVVPNRKKALRFPAGTYIITGTVFLPPNATIVGDGPGSTVFIMSTTTNTRMVQTKDISGVTLPSTGMELVDGVSIEGITFRYDSRGLSVGSGFSNTQPLLSIDRAQNFQVLNCTFEGNYSVNNIANSNLSPSSDTYAGIEIRNIGGPGTNNIIIKDSVFKQLKYGIRGNYDIADVFISNNKFVTLNRGVIWADNLYANNNAGPIRTKITHNLFEDIYNEGIYVGVNKKGPARSNYSADHVSAFNSFVNVGNTIQVASRNDLITTSTVQVPAISFLSPGNVSIEDRFSRDTIIQNIGGDTDSFKPSVFGRTGIHSNIAYTATMVTSAVTPTTLVRIPYAGVDQLINLSYIVTSPDQYFTRKGDVKISVANYMNTTTVTESYTNVGPDGGVVFSATLDKTHEQVRVNYTWSNPNASDGVVIEYKYNYLG